MDSVDITLLKHLSKRENMEQHADLIDKGICTKESWQLFNDFKDYFQSNTNTTEIDNDFKLWFRLTKHPGWKAEQHQLYDAIIDNVLQSTGSSEAFEEQIRVLQLVRTLLSRGQELQLGRLDPAQTVETLLEELGDWRTQSGDGDGDSPYYDTSLVDAMSTANRGTSFFWRCEDLNKSIGPLHKGDFVLVAKRPEIGGTSFLCSELTFMLEQLPTGGKALIFNNEEEMSKLKGRVITSALNLDARDLMIDPQAGEDAFSVWLGDKELRLVKHENSTEWRDIEQLCSQEEPDLIGINVICSSKLRSKLGSDSADHDKLQSLGAASRALAHKHAPVLGIVQADPSAEGLAYIPQDRIYKSKTALQGEADALIMIGHEEGSPDDVRHIHVAKNKMPPHPCTLPMLKHLKTDVHFDASTGRFTSNHHKGNSYAGNNSTGSGNE